ncbi:hypothetical protein E9961_07675 [Salmonella enterica]|nr:hypothetical protein [Salmonella enterica]ECJ0308386.1 hypothetical protein [Salmonella enterica]
MAVREGLTRFARPFGSYVKKKPVLSYELFLEYGGEGGIDSLCSPLRVICEKKARTFVRALS